MANNRPVKKITIEKLLTQDKYLIPIYQRDYAWEQKEITQFIQDVWDYAEKEKDKEDKQPYYIGTLVTHKRKDGKYEVLDGQQRLTALYILVAALKSLGESIENIKAEKLNLHFEAREKSKNALDKVLKIKKETEEIYAEKYEQPSIIDGFNIAKNYLKNKENNICLREFTNYLLNNVILVRTIVPPDTDLNHYFEIMNNRGEQLEKHEILKAELLKKIDDNLRTQYAKVWDACSQMNFDSGDRGNLFGENWDNLNIDKISCIQKTGDNKRAEDNQNQEKNKNTIECVLKRKEDILKNNTDSSTNNESERFKSIIDFPDFLLQVLKVTRNNYQRKENEGEENPKSNISLNEQMLQGEFDKFKGKGGCFAKEFIENLLKYRFWFDKYIIKRGTVEDKENEWSLKSWVENNGNNDLKNTSSEDNGDEEITMIQSMFHVSFPQKSGKNWLQKVFEKCKSDIENRQEPEEFLNKLEGISRELFAQKNDLEQLSYNEKRPTGYTFNLLDYVIWKENKKEDTEKRYKVEKISNFSFKSRNSVEHFYPQNPANGEKNIKELHSFGNLALTTKSFNARWSNFLPKDKLKYLGAKEEKSLKFQLMIAQAENWKDETIKKHQEDMIELLKGYLQQEP